MGKLRLTLGELEITTKDLFNAGITSFKVLDLDQSDAMEYKRSFEQLRIRDIKTRIENLSLQNDPLNERPRYAVLVYR